MLAALAVGSVAQAVKPSSNPNLARALFQQALAVVYAIPAPDQPSVRAYILQREVVQIRADALRPYPQLSQAALALPGSAAARFDAAPLDARGGKPRGPYLAFYMRGIDPVNQVRDIYMQAGIYDFATAAHVRARPSMVLRPLAEAAVAGVWQGSR